MAGPLATRPLATDEWETPDWLFERLNREFRFTRDLAAQPWNAKVVDFYTPEDDALEQPWDGVCWLNPPYGGELYDWTSKAWAAAQCGATVVYLLPVRTETAWWHENVMLADEIRFVRRRLRFLGGAGQPRFASVVVVFRHRAGRGMPRVSTIEPEERA